MRLTLQLQRLALGVAVLAALVTCGFPGAARAQDDNVLHQLLREARDYRVRERAAAALGRRPGARSALALEAALNDRHPAVRIAAARALGQLGAAEALPALRKCAREPVVAKHARHSIAQIELAQKHRGVAAGPARPVRYSVWIGELRDRSREPAEGMLPVLANSLDEALRTIDGVSMLGLDGTPAGIPIYRVDGQIIDTNRALLEDKVTAHASVALLLTAESDKTLKIVFKGSSTTIEDLDRKGIAQPERVAKLAIERAVRAALRNASSAMSEALARR
jgi:hypothetical protein